MKKMLAIARATFVETTRQPIYGVVLLSTLFLMPLNVGLAAFTLKDDNKLLMELGLSTLLLSGLFLASFSASSVLTREIENKTVLTIVSKPVSRPVFLMGKYLGLILALALAYYVGFLGFFLSVQHKVLESSADEWHWPVLVFGPGMILFVFVLAGIYNFFRDKPFIGTVFKLGVPLLTLGAVATCFFGRSWQVGQINLGIANFDVFKAAFLVFCSVMMLTAIALAASTRVGQVLTLLICVGVLMVGLISDYLLSQAAEASVVARVAYKIIPNFNFFWIIDAVNAGMTIPNSYVGLTAAYATCVSLAALLAGAVLFQRREVG
ncbi:MAG: ABC transporter permease subunit [Planctomycetes bacterium]|nr:ABC transporter permease subunit [Planctomycetota bacterium]